MCCAGLGVVEQLMSQVSARLRESSEDEMLAVLGVLSLLIWCVITITDCAKEKKINIIKIGVSAVYFFSV